MSEHTEDKIMFDLLPGYKESASVHLREDARKLLTLIQSEARGSGRKERMSHEIKFISDGSGVVIHKFACLRHKDMLGYADEVDDIHGVDLVKNFDPEIVRTIASEHLEAAGIGNIAEKHLFDEEDAEEMVFIPDETYDAILNEATAQFRSILMRAAGK